MNKTRGGACGTSSPSSGGKIRPDLQAFPPTRAWGAYHGGTTPQDVWEEFLEEMSLELRSEEGEVSSMKRAGKNIPGRGNSLHRSCVVGGSFVGIREHVKAGEVEREGDQTRKASGVLKDRAMWIRLRRALSPGRGQTLRFGRQ